MKTEFIAGMCVVARKGVHLVYIFIFT